VLNVTVTETESNGYLTVFPCGAPIPTASNLNYGKDETIANTVIAELGDDGNVCVFTPVGLHLVVDVAGYLSATSSYNAVEPARLLDTRPNTPTVDGQSNTINHRLNGDVTTVRVAGRGGVPADAEAAIINVTVTDPEQAGYVTIYPCGTDPPITSNGNYRSGQTVATAAISKIGSDGSICIYTPVHTQLVADINGYYN